MRGRKARTCKLLEEVRIEGRGWEWRKWRPRMYLGIRVESWPVRRRRWLWLVGRMYMRLYLRLLSYPQRTWVRLLQRIRLIGRVIVLLRSVCRRSCVQRGGRVRVSHFNSTRARQLGVGRNSQNNDVIDRGLRFHEDDALSLKNNRSLTSLRQSAI